MLQRRTSTATARAHARRRHPSASEQHLIALGAAAPEISPELYQPIAHEKAVRALRLGTVTVVAVIVVALLGVQWFRPVPAPVFHAALPTSLRLPGPALALPWPATGSAELAVLGGGVLGRAGSSQPVPIAGLAKVMTAYVVLRDHPLAAEADGPTIPVSARAIATYQQEQASRQSTIPLAAGETLSERQALEGLLVASDNDMATLLADWDAGSAPAFVAKMAVQAKALGLSSSTFTDPSGLDPGTASTPGDLVRLAEAAVVIPAFAQIVALPQVTLPSAGTLYNLNYELGRGGVIGIKTGADAFAGGCYLVEARREVGGQSLTLVGAVLGQQAVPPTGAAVDAAAALVKAAFAGAGPEALVRAGQPLGRISTSWGSSVAVVAPGPITVVGWAGATASAGVRVTALSLSLPLDARVGTLSVIFGAQRIDMALRTSGALGGPSALWRLTRL